MHCRTSLIACALLVVATVGTSQVESQNSATASRQPRLTLQRLVDPATHVEVDGRVVSFALLGLIRFETVADLFQHIDRESGRWRFGTNAERQAFGDDLLRRGVESRIVSMETELPLEILLTHTQAAIEHAIAALRTSDAPDVFRGRHWQVSVESYRDAFVRVRERWQQSLNCWSAAPSIAGRVLSNWYLIDEGIELFGAVYDSTEHFWQAVKYHPDVTLQQVRDLVAAFKTLDWRAWIAALENDQPFYFEHAYSVEFLEFYLRPEQFDRFDRELAAAGAPEERSRTMQQRGGREAGRAVRFTSLQEKVLWGDLADVFHLVSEFAKQGRASLPPGADKVRAALTARHFDAIYLPGHPAGRFPFLSPVFQELMFEIWKVKYLQMPRFGEVIRSTAGRRLDHFLNDGDSPDIPIRVYVDQLNRIRDLAFAQAKTP